MHLQADRTSTIDDDGPVRRVDLVAWPAEAHRLAERRLAGRPSLLVVDPESAIPELSVGEDWIWRSAGERDVSARLAQLARSQPREGHLLPAVPDLPDGTSVPAQRLTARLVADIGTFVSAADAAATVFAGTALDHGALSALAAEVRVALPTGWNLLVIGSAGLLLERVDP
ncbi:hypothetical protein BH10ACT1_BH10ACT1_32200 [soil metagenome]